MEGGKEIILLDCDDADSDHEVKATLVSSPERPMALSAKYV